MEGGFAVDSWMCEKGDVLLTPPPTPTSTPNYPHEGPPAVASCEVSTGCSGLGGFCGGGRGVEVTRSLSLDSRRHLLRGLTCDVIPHLRHDRAAFTGKFMPPMPFISARQGEVGDETQRTRTQGEAASPGRQPWRRGTFPLFHLFYCQALSAAAATIIHPASPDDNELEKEKLTEGFMQNREKKKRNFGIIFFFPSIDLKATSREGRGLNLLLLFI